MSASAPSLAKSTLYPAFSKMRLLIARMLSSSSTMRMVSFPQHRKDVHRRVPSAIPGPATPAAVGSLKGEQPRPHSLRGNPGAFGGEQFAGLPLQVAHHLPTNRRIRVQKPVHDGASRFREIVLRGIACHLVIHCTPLQTMQNIASRVVPPPGLEPGQAV